MSSGNDHSMTVSSSSSAASNKKASSTTSGNTSGDYNQFSNDANENFNVNSNDNEEVLVHSQGELKIPEFIFYSPLKKESIFLNYLI